MNDRWVLDLHICVRDKSFKELEKLEEIISNLVSQFSSLHIEPDPYSIGGGIVPEVEHEQQELASL